MGFPQRLRGTFRILTWGPSPQTPTLTVGCGSWVVLLPWGYGSGAFLAGGHRCVALASAGGRAGLSGAARGRFSARAPFPDLASAGVALGFGCARPGGAGLKKLHMGAQRRAATRRCAVSSATERKNSAAG